MGLCVEEDANLLQLFLGLLLELRLSAHPPPHPYLEGQRPGDFALCRGE